MNPRWTVTDIESVLTGHYPPTLAESWDRVGLVCGDPTRPVRKALLTVDITRAVIAQAREVEADMVIAHHPLLLRGVHAIDAREPKGAMVWDAAQHGLALYAAHTNADIPSAGVCAALAQRIGLTDLAPLDPRTLDGDPAAGIGRIGTLDTPLTAADFAQQIADALPQTATGVRLAGDPERPVTRVAVLAGAGDSHLDAARQAGVDAYVTSDLRHHPATEALEWDDAPALIDVAHWAAEWSWLPVLEEILTDELPGLDTQISTLRTDAWTRTFQPR